MNRFAILLALGGALLLSIYFHVAPPQPAVEAEVTQSSTAVQRDGASSTSMRATDDARLETEARDVLRRYDIDASLADQMATDYARTIRSSQELIVALTDWLGDATERIEGTSAAESSRAIAETMGTALRLAGRVATEAKSLEAQLDGLVELKDERDALREAYTWREVDENIYVRLKADIGVNLEPRLGDSVDALFRDVADLARSIDAVKAQLRAQSDSESDFEARWDALNDDLADLIEPEIERRADELETTAERFGDAVERFAQAHPFRVTMDVLPVLFGKVDVQINIR